MTTKFDDVMNVSEAMNVSEGKYFLPPPSPQKKKRQFVPFVQFKKRKKHPWTSVTFSNVAG